MNLNWTVNDRTGSRIVKEQTHIIVPMRAERAETVEAEIRIPPAEAMFFNGYQSWTLSREYGPTDIQNDIRLPQVIINRYSLDRYGDSYFVKYPRAVGKFHGFSYCYFRDGDQFQLFASLDEKPGYTLFFYDVSAQTLVLKRDCAGVIETGDFHAFDLYYRCGSEDEVFGGWFRTLGIANDSEPLCGYSSWYNRYQNITIEAIRRDLEGCRGLLAPGDLFQIDDGWQQQVGDWLPDEGKFPDGMRALVDEIHSAGFSAGLWLAPFAAAQDSEVVRQHPDWIIRVDGEPFSCGCNWGGFYALDWQLPAVEDHLIELFNRVFREWDFDVVKLDFLYTAALFNDPRQSRGRRMDEAMAFLRRLCGSHKIMGCGVPLMPAFGRVDYCRIGCDVSLDWNDSIAMRFAHPERVSTANNLMDTVYRRQLNHRAFVNDPDVFFLRRDNLKLNDAEKRHLAVVDALLGGVMMISDDPGAYDAGQTAAYRRLLDLHRHASGVRFGGGGSRRCLRYQYQGQTRFEPLGRPDNRPLE
jgi:alpha-galactosidase